jgi:hypothetical protein
MVASAAFAQSQAPQDPTVPVNTRSRQTPSNPPIQVTVSVPEPDPEVRKREAANRQREIEIQERSVEIQDAVALFTERLVYVGVAQVVASLFAFWVSWKAASAAQKSADATRAAVVLAHRPKLVVRNVVVPSLSDGNYRGSGTLGGTLWVTNTGGTVATDIRFRMVWLIDTELPMKNPILSQKTLPKVKLLNAGRSTAIRLPAQSLNPDDIRKSTTYGSARSLYLIGIAKFRDQHGELRRTAFCRRFDWNVNRFKAVDDEDYEHAD